MDIINEAIKRYRPASKSMLVVDITDKEIMQYLVNMSQDMTVNEDQRIEARDACIKMVVNRSPPQVLPVLMTQEEIVMVEEVMTHQMTLANNRNNDHLQSRMRSVRRAALAMMANAPEPTALPLRWEETRQHAFVDVPHVGRYLVKRKSPRSREWVAYLSGRPTTFRGTRDEVKAMVERFVRSTPAHEHIGHHVAERTAKEVR